MSNINRVKKSPSFLYSLVVLISIIGFITCGMLSFKANLQVMMFLSWFLIGLFAYGLGWSFEELENAAFSMIYQAMQAVILMAAVGVLISAWISAGTVPTIIYFGLKIISPKIFLVTTVILCSLTSLATGSSWTTMGTVGLSMLGIGIGLNIPVGITVGAIISGAYFGDKMSPLSDSTNLASAVCKVNIFTHIKHMCYTTIPAILISLIVYWIIGLKYVNSHLDHDQIDNIINRFDTIFNIGWITLLPAIIVLILIFRKVSPVFALLVGSIVAIAIAVIYQGIDFTTVFSSLWNGFTVPNKDELMAKFLNRGGIKSMMGTIALMLFALGLGGMLKETGILEVILNKIAHNINKVGKLVFSTMIISYFSSMLSGSMHFSAVITGTLMGPLFEKLKLKPENLSRIIEDCGTLGAALIPWSTNAVFIMSMLQVSYLEYMPFSFLNWIDPIISLLLGVTGITMLKMNEIKNINN